MKTQKKAVLLIGALLTVTLALSFGEASKVLATHDPYYGACSPIGGNFPCGGDYNDYDNDGLSNDEDPCPHDPDRHCGIPELVTTEYRSVLSNLMIRCSITHEDICTWILNRHPVLVLFPYPTSSGQNAYENANLEINGKQAVDMEACVAGAMFDREVDIFSHSNDNEEQTLAHPDGLWTWGVKSLDQHELGGTAHGSKTVWIDLSQILSVASEVGVDPYALFVQVVLYETYHMLDTAPRTTEAEKLEREKHAQAFAYDMFKILYGSHMEPPIAREGFGFQSMWNLPNHNPIEHKLISCS